MTYANSTTKRSQVLAALETRLAAIAPTDYASTVKRAWTYSGHRLVMGGETPAVAILPTEDTRNRSLACAADEYLMSVEIVCVIRIAGETDEWQDAIGLLVGDVQQLVANDRQLGGIAAYVEVDGVVITDALTDGSGTYAIGSVPCTIAYRVSTADVTA